MNSVIWLEIEINQDLISVTDLALSYLSIHYSKAFTIGNGNTIPTSILKNKAIEQNDSLKLLGIMIDRILLESSY